jgi:glycosyltransferase involved in cell wall biosynthesis
VAVAIPAFNESEGIGEFLSEIDEALKHRVSRLDLIVIDDNSTDGTADVVRSVATKVRANVELLEHDRNRGHGPAVLEGYRLAILTRADLVLQVDGDGQFLGSDLRRLIVLLEDGAEAVCGVRRYRQDPWFRMLMTRLVRMYVSIGFRVPTRDANCPLRGYRRETLTALLSALPPETTIPNLFLTVLAARRGVTMVEVDVTHRVRRGMHPDGTTWRRHRLSPIPWRLVQFSISATRESQAFRRALDDGALPSGSIEQ